MKIAYNISTEYDQYSLRRFLRVNFPHLSQDAIHKFIRTGDIRINGVKADINYILKSQDQLQIWDKLTQPEEEKEISSKKEYQFLEKCILDKTKDYWVIDKPAGLSMQGGSRIKVSADYLLTGMMMDWDPQAKPYLVHRLDRNTSGVCVVATNHQAAFALSNQFKHRKMSKTYVALCHNLTKTKLMRNHTFSINKSIDDKEAITQCVVKGVYNIKTKDNNNHELLVIQFNPITGRKHQIRKHCLMSNLPICGDYFYYPETFFKQMHLHAYILEHTYKTDLISPFIYKANFPEHMKDYEQFFL